MVNAQDRIASDKRGLDTHASCVPKRVANRVGVETMPRKKLPRYPCRVDGCERISMYAKDQLCQMHYFRRMRGGTFEKRQKPKDRYIHSAGYILLRKPGHPLSNSRGIVYEHRAVLYEIYGEEIPDCEMCGAPSRWDSRDTHVDHINMDKSDNRPHNLRVLCNSCNVGRGSPKPMWTRSNAIAVNVDGVIQTPTEWARHENCEVTPATIRRRLAAGMTPHEAVFNPRPKKVPKQRPQKHTRKNAVVAIIDGIKLTAAEWSRHPDCSVCQRTIVNRLRAGMSHVDAVFMPPRTNKGARP